MTIVYGKRSLVTLLQQTSAVNPTELSEAIDSELVTEDELADQDISGKADKAAAIATADGVAVVAADADSTTAADAATQTGAYVQADVQSIADLANELKVDYNSAVTLVNELKAKLDTLTTLVNELKSTVNTMNA